MFGTKSAHSISFIRETNQFPSNIDVQCALQKYSVVLNMVTLLCLIYLENNKCFSNN